MPRAHFQKKRAAIAQGQSQSQSQGIKKVQAHPIQKKYNLGIISVLSRRKSLG